MKKTPQLCLFLLLIGMLISCTAASPTVMPTVAPTIVAQDEVPSAETDPAATSLPPTTPPVVRAPISRETVSQLQPQARLGRGTTRDMALSPDGSLLALATALGVTLYDVDSAELIATFPTDEAIDDLGFSFDGQLLGVRQSPSNTVAFFHLPSQQPLATLPGDPAVVSSVSFHPQAHLAAVQTAEGVAIVDPNNANTVITLESPLSGQSKPPQFSPDGSQVAAIVNSGAEGAVALWHMGSGEMIRTLTPAETRILDHGQFSPDGTQFAALGREQFANNTQQIHVWELANDDPPRVYTAPDGVAGSSWAFSPDGSHLAAGLVNGHVAIWEHNSAEPRHVFTPDQPTLPTALAFSPDGSRVLVGREFGEIEQISVADGSLLATSAEQPDSIRRLAPHPNDDDLFFLSSSGLVGALDASGTLNHSFDQHAIGAIQSVAFAPDSAEIMTGSANGFVTVWDAASAEMARQLPNHGGTVQALAFTPDQSQLVTGVGERVGPIAFDDSVRVWAWQAPSAETPTALFGGEGEDVPGCSAFRSSLAISADGSTLAIGSHDFTVELRDLASGETLTVFDQHLGPVYDVDFAPSGSLLASAADDGFVRVFDGDTLTISAEISNGVEAVTAVAFSPDGSTLASATISGTITLWDTATWEPIHTISSDKNRFGSLVFSPDGSLLAAGAGFDQVQLWDAATLDPVARLSEPQSLIEAVAFSPDGTQLAAGSLDGTVHVWGVE